MILVLVYIVLVSCVLLRVDYFNAGLICLWVNLIRCCTFDFVVLFCFWFCLFVYVSLFGFAMLGLTVCCLLGTYLLYCIG